MQTGNDNINIFPNPAQNNITIDVRDLHCTICDLLIYDVVGNLVFGKQLYNRNTKIDISSLPDGVYIAEVKTDKGIEVKKFVKE